MLALTEYVEHVAVHETEGSQPGGLAALRVHEGSGGTRAHGVATSAIASSRRRSAPVPRSAMWCAASSRTWASSAEGVRWGLGSAATSRQDPVSGPFSTNLCHQAARASRRWCRRSARLSFSIWRPGRRSCAEAILASVAALATYPLMASMVLLPC